ncbi:hypothetical protein OSB04_030178 [Centaurea solstitialis]|uniref:FAD-binding PCMH-type domain-containing protein n=1 Tax=Centaurea solstitialis TaxID=347529 RepID=A0AA38SJQ3_9ASTR|nr:hypothetical protein OSB04_030178 [Centaurea solstitialis]
MAIIISSSFNMQFSIFALLFLLLSFQSFATSSTSTTSTTDRFIQCLHDRSDPSFPITGEVYTPVNSSFPSVLQAYIRNLRFNETTTPKPILIITALHPSHVQAAVAMITKGFLTFLNSNQPFFVVDMFNLRSVNVSIEQETAWVQAGATLGEVYYRIAEKSNTHGFPAGVCPTVGVGGHISGGGYGNLMRKYGLSVDNVIDAELIDDFNRKSMGEDLFWAITGGGGVSFGVVLSYTIKLVRVPAVVTVFNVERTYEQNLTTIAERWVEVADKFDKDLFVRMTFNVVNDTNGQKTIRAIFPSLYLGNSTTLVTLLNKDFPELGLRISDCTEMSWIESVLFYTNFPMNERNFRICKPFPHRAGNIAKIQYEVNWEELGDEAANRYLNFTRMMYEYMTPFVSKNPREAFLNYRDLDIGVNSQGKNAYAEGMWHDDVGGVCLPLNSSIKRQLLNH